MSSPRLTAVAAAVSMVLAFITGTVTTAAAQPVSADPSEAAEQEIRAASDGPVWVRRDEHDRVQSVRTTAGHPVQRPDGITSATAAESAARAHLDDYEALFGVDDQASELRLEKAFARPGGGEVVRFQQRVDDVPVVGGSLVVALDGANNLQSVTAETATEVTAPGDPVVDADQARATALRVTAEAHGVSIGRLSTSTPQQWVYDPSLLGAPGRPVARPVWRVEVTNGLDGDIRELVLVDAARGSVPLHFDQVAEALNRRVCDSNNGQVRFETLCSPSEQAARVEGDTEPSPVQDVNDAYDYSGDTYRFYSTVLARDSVDNAGFPLRSVVRFCSGAPGEPCPYRNAFWNGDGMVYGTGYAGADDVVGHEITHGVIEHTADLFSVYQSGALNESIADVMGELVDLGNGAGTDGAAQRWLVGEDLPGGAIRDMQDPTQSPGSPKQPDRMTSGLWWADPSFVDNGGVHINSGVGNKAAFLVTDGGTFNGVTVAGRGAAQAAKIWYEALLMLAPGADYADLADALAQGCANLVSRGQATTADCGAVAAAVTAVEMRRQPVVGGAAAPEAAMCPVAEPARTQLLDDMEGPGVPGWSRDARYWSTTEHFAGGSYAHSGRQWLLGYELDLEGSAPATLQAPVSIPAGSRASLHLHQSYDFRGGGDVSARVEYQADGGPWTDLRTLPSVNGYSTDRGFAGNTKSNGWSSTRWDVSALAGRQVLVRFHLEQHGVSNGSVLGWNIDDVSIHTCHASTTSASLSRSSLTYGGTATLSGTVRPTEPGDEPLVGGQQVRLYQRPVGASSWTPGAWVPTNEAGAYRTHVRPGRNLEYFVRYPGTSAIQGSYSAVSTVRVRPVVSIAVNDADVRLGTVVRFSGAVAPSHAGHTVHLQRFQRGAWRTAKTAVVSSASRYGIRWRTDSRTDFRWRVRLPVHADHLAGTSAGRRVVVR